jgi:hypothetical protein
MSLQKQNTYKLTMKAARGASNDSHESNRFRGTVWSKKISYVVASFWYWNWLIITRSRIWLSSYRFWIFGDSKMSLSFHSVWVKMRWSWNRVNVTSSHQCVWLCLWPNVTDGSQPLMEREMCEHYWLSVLMYTPGKNDFTNEEQIRQQEK